MAQACGSDPARFGEPACGSFIGFARHRSGLVRHDYLFRDVQLKPRWKPLEAILAALGGVSDDVRNLLEDDETAHRPPSIDIQYLFDNVIPGLLGASDTPFLQGRAFVFASQFASLLSPQLSGQYLDAAVTALGSPDVPIPVKISAVKTIKKCVYD